MKRSRIFKGVVLRGGSTSQVKAAGNEPGKFLRLELSIYYRNHPRRSTSASVIPTCNQLEHESFLW